MTADVRLAQALCSRLCHDLVGSVSAIGSGLELISEDPSDIDGPLDLMGRSAEQTARRLSFFRGAFGLAAGRQGQATAGELRQLCADFLAGSRVHLVWEDNADLPAASVLPKVPAKAALNGVLLAAECLPRGGAVTVNVARLPDGVGVAVEATGDGAHLPDEAATALAGDDWDEVLSPRTAHIVLVRSLLAGHGGTIEIDCQADGSVRIGILAPAVD